MHLRPILLIIACLLGGCEKKDAAPGSHPPDIATTKSAVREADNESRATRGERPEKSAAIQAIDRWLAAPEGSDESGSLAGAALEAIKNAEPAEFEAIWKRMRRIDRGEQILLYAIYHLAARKDLHVAGQKVRELMEPDIPRGLGYVIRASLFNISEPTLKEAFDFLREPGEEHEREHIADCFPLIKEQQDALMSLQAAGYRLDEKETALLMRVLLRTEEHVDVLADRHLAETTRLLQTISSLEGQGTLANGARENHLIWIGRVHPSLFMKLIPPGELVSQLRKEGNDPVLASLVRSGGDPFASGEYYPHYFFTPTGTRNFPPEKTHVALNSWHDYQPEGAEQWFSDNAASLPQSQQDLIRATFARNTWTKDVAAAQAWVDEITDPALREKASHDRPTDEERRAEAEPNF